MQLNDDLSLRIKASSAHVYVCVHVRFIQYNKSKSSLLSLK